MRNWKKWLCISLALIAVGAVALAAEKPIVRRQYDLEGKVVGQKPAEVTYEMIASLPHEYRGLAYTFEAEVYEVRPGSVLTPETAEFVLLIDGNEAEPILCVAKDLGVDLTEKERIEVAGTITGQAQVITAGGTAVLLMPAIEAESITKLL